MTARIPIWSWRHAIQSASIKPLTKLVLFIIANDVSECGKFTRMTIAELCEASGLSKRAVIDHLAYARDAGFLAIERSRNSAGHVIGTRYFPRFPECFTLATEPAQEVQSARDAPLLKKPFLVPLL